MCGIAGYSLTQNTNYTPPSADSVIKLLSHRGPDDMGHFGDPKGRIKLFHTRLAILDPSPLGAQPMG